MSMKSSTFAAALVLGCSVVALDAGSNLTLALDAPGSRFGAPPLPLDKVAPAARQPAADASFLPNRSKLPDTGSADASDPGQPNLSALRFYAGQNDLACVAAEIRLLRAKFPGWEPPSDIFTEGGGESEQPLWDLFGKHDFPGLKAAIAERQQQTPGWQPSADLTAKLAAAEAYQALVEASDRKDYDKVVDLASSNRGLMTCATIDAVWRTAEALSLTGDEPHALDAYRFILSNCSEPKERLATVQKAATLIKTPEAIDSLVRTGRRLPDGTTEFADIRFDGMRQRIGAAAASSSATPPSASDLDQVSARARAAGGAKDAELLGWYALSRKDFAGAETWFRGAMQPTPTAKAAEGLVLALRDGGKMQDAVKLAPQYAALGPLNRKLMMEILVANLADAKEAPTTEQLATLGAAIDAEKSSDAAQSFGWSRFKANDVVGAEGWFKKSLDWQPNEAAAVGLMLAARRLKHASDYASVVSRYRTSFNRVAEIDGAMNRPVRYVQPTRQASIVRSRRGQRVARGDAWDQSATAIVQTFQGGQVDQALSMMNARRASRSEPKGLSVVRGWALYKNGDWEEARRVFTDVGNRGMQAEAREGLKQIELGYTNPRYR